jgi:hypothetical protein
MEYSWVALGIGCVIGLVAAYITPTTSKKYKGRPWLAIILVKLRRSKRWSWLGRQLSFGNDNNWYLDIVEKDIEELL